MTLQPETPVRCRMRCSYCTWRVMMSGPAVEVAQFLRKLALEHVETWHPEKVPAGDLELALMNDLGFH